MPAKIGSFIDICPKIRNITKRFQKVYPIIRNTIFSVEKRWLLQLFLPKTTQDMVKKPIPIGFAATRRKFDKTLYIVLFQHFAQNAYNI